MSAMKVESSPGTSGLAGKGSAEATGVDVAECAGAAPVVDAPGCGAGCSPLELSSGPVNIAATTLAMAPMTATVIATLPARGSRELSPVVVLWPIPGSVRAPVSGDAPAGFAGGLGGALRGLALVACLFFWLRR